MSRYIDAGKLAKVYMGKGKDKLSLATVINELELAPTADVVEVAHLRPGSRTARNKRGIGMEGKRYDCPICANRNSPLCELCTQITSPGGSERKPRYYIELAEVARDMPGVKLPVGLSAELEKRATVIAKHLGVGLPIPIRTVLEYNKLAEYGIGKEE